LDGDFWDLTTSLTRDGDVSLPQERLDPSILICFADFVYTMGAMTFVMFLSRFALFHLFESPKFLLSRGRQAEAVAVVHGMASKNRTKTWLTEDILNKIGGHPETVQVQKLTDMEIVNRKLSSFSTERIAPLFHTRKLAITTLLLWFCWLAIGIG
jgi:hypothetical protein